MMENEEKPKQQETEQDIPVCEPGYYWDAETQQCILDVGEDD